MRLGGIRQAFTTTFVETWDSGDNFEPWQIMPSQMKTHRQMNGVEELAWAVLGSGVCEALGCGRLSTGTRTVNIPEARRMVTKKARFWIDNTQHTESPYGFVNLCEYFGLDHHRLRIAIKSAANKDHALRERILLNFGHGYQLTLETNATNNCILQDLEEYVE